MNEEKELKELFNRILFVIIVGLVGAHLSHFTNPFFISFHSVIIIMSLRRYNLKVLLIRIGVICAGLIFGLISTEIFHLFPQLQNIIVYTMFVTTLKLFSHRYKEMDVFMFNFCFVYASIFGSYLESTFELEIFQYFGQLFWVFILITVTFKLFPSNLKEKEMKTLKESKIKMWEIHFFAFFLLLFWDFFMVFEWRFAFFAYACLIALFKGFDMEYLKFKAVINIKIHFKACLISAVFSVLLYGMIQNVPLMTLGLLLMFIPIVKNLVYNKGLEEIYSNATLISGLVVPLTLYINLDAAAVYKCFLRSNMITFVMGIILFILKLLPNRSLSENKNLQEG